MAFVGGPSIGCGLRPRGNFGRARLGLRQKGSVVSWMAFSIVFEKSVVLSLKKIKTSQVYPLYQPPRRRAVWFFVVGLSNLVMVGSSNLVVVSSSNLVVVGSSNLQQQ